MWGRRSRALLLPVAAVAIGCIDKTGPVLGPPVGVPLPDVVGPAPSPAQVAWQTREVAAFLHFGMNTFTNKEQGDGTESPSSFNPTAFNARQWVTTLRNAGVREALLTAKHHDGFCLWPTTCTTYSVAASPFQGGKGDIVRDFVDAAHEGNLRVALALSPLDRHDPSYGTPAYEKLFECQLGELLNNYGTVDEIWLWGLGPLEPTFDWVAIRDFVHRIQPQTLLEFANAAAVPPSEVHSIALSSPGAPPAPSDQSSVQTPPGAAGPEYIPAEAVYGIRPSWFWHAAEDNQVKTLAQLLDFYFDSVGRNSLLRLNVPPDNRGLLADPDVAVLNQLGPAIDTLYRTNVAAGRPATADSVFQSLAPYAATSAVDGNVDTFWAAAAGQTTARLEIDLGGPQSFDLISLQEPIALGERTTTYHVDAQTNGVWKTIATGTAIGERKLFRMSAVTADRVALVITGARGAPAISELGFYDSTP